MRDLTGGETTVAVEGHNVRQVVDDLERKYPGVKERLCSGDRLKPSIRVAVDGVVSRLGLLQRVGEQSEVHFLPAVAGGRSSSPSFSLSHAGERESTVAGDRSPLPGMGEGPGVRASEERKHSAVEDRPPLPLTKRGQG
jgi:molybdopterin synthase sulfur carrier subunit